VIKLSTVLAQSTVGQEMMAAEVRRIKRDYPDAVIVGDEVILPVSAISEPMKAQMVDLWRKETPEIVDFWKAWPQVKGGVVSAGPSPHNLPRSSPTGRILNEETIPSGVLESWEHLRKKGEPPCGS